MPPHPPGRAHRDDPAVWPLEDPGSEQPPSVKSKNARKLVLLVLAAALAGTAAYARRFPAPASEQLQDSVKLEVIEDFLADARRYFGLQPASATR